MQGRWLLTPENRGNKPVRPKTAICAPASTQPASARRLLSRLSQNATAGDNFPGRPGELAGLAKSTPMDFSHIVRVGSCRDPLVPAHPDDGRDLRVWTLVLLVEVESYSCSFGYGFAVS
jgi:hypothetical protein